ncbi:translocation/assembly module TamB domain-containing protein [Tropicibacter naphthalenivorans]|nr:translocation/assembly module TamB domain-containing protein [Tropicibacter naphthalenivorans]
MLLLPLTAWAQDSETDRGYIQGLLEDALSAEGRSVQMQGFAGALSSRATIDKITVTDPDGAWLTMSDIALVWNRSALLRGAIDIEEITVGTIDLPRAPLPAPGEVPAPEASGSFALPDLPVSLNIAKMRIGRATLGQPLFGQAATIAFDGSAQLANGAGAVKLAITRQDQAGSVTLDAAFDNATRNLRLDLNLTEPENGIAANLLNLPGKPSVSLTAKGDDPLSDFTATVALATAGQPRLDGTVTLLTDQAGTSRFALDVGGDIAPVFAPEFADFLGDDVALVTRGARDASGALTLDTLDVRAAALSLTGSAQIGADGWPQTLRLDGAITPPDGERVLLPLSGEPTYVRAVTLSGQFDAAEGDTWLLAGRATGLERGPLQAERLGFDGSGQIDRTGQRVTGEIDLDAVGLNPGEAALATAIGEQLQGLIRFDWTNGQPLEISQMDLTGFDYGLTGAVTISGLDDPEALTVAPDLQLAARDLSRFAALAGQDLGGQARLNVTGTAAPLTGLVDLRLDGQTTDLSTGIAQLDPLLAGIGTLTLDLIRDESGLRADPLLLRTDAARIDATALIRTGRTTAELRAEVTDLALVQPGLDGAAVLTADLTQDDDAWKITADGTLPGDTRFGVTGTVTGDGTTALTVDGGLTAEVARLSVFSQLTNRRLSGSATLTARGQGDLLAGVFDASASGKATDLGIDAPSVAPLLRGTARFDVTANRNAAGVMTIDATTALPGQTTASFNGTVTGDGKTDLKAQGTLTARTASLNAFSALTGQRLSGSAEITANATADLLAGDFDVQANGQTVNLGIGNTSVDPLLRGTLRLTAEVSRQNGVLNIAALNATAPGISADISGQYGEQSGDLRYALSVTNLGQIVPDLPGRASVTGTATLSGNRWQIDASGNGPGGIFLNVRGGVQPDGPRLDLNVSGNAPLALANGRLSGQAVSGLVRFDLAVNGPPALTSVSGRVSLSDARLSIPGQSIAINGISGQIDLASGRANIAIGGDVASGGGIEITGPVTLSAPFDADLTARLFNVTLRSANLYEAKLGGTVTMAGALAGGARIGGSINVETVELEIPNLGPSYAALDGLRHLNPSADVQRTLRFAGLSQTPEASGGGTSRPYPIDLTVNAPNRLFVRGRGLDAELGGNLRLTGTTADIVPVGQFDLIRGRLDLLTRRLTLTEGAVRLRGSFDPYIDFAAATEVEDVSITLRIAGFASAPELTITSSPALPQEEALSFFLFGKDVTSISALQAVQLAAAIRTLSGSGGAGITEKIRRNLGVDDLDIGTDGDGNAQAKVGKYLTDNIYTDVTVNSGGDTQINLNLDLSDNVTVRGRLNNDGDTGIGVFFEKDY